MINNPSPLSPIGHVAIGLEDVTKGGSDNKGARMS